MAKVDGFRALADVLSGGKARSGAHRATVSRIDADGTAYVRFPGNDIDMPVHGVLASVQPGDEVQVTIAGGRATIAGNASDLPASSSSVRAIDARLTRTAEALGKAAKAAQAAAAEAEAVANATGQHFWDDDNGAHVTDVTRDEWAAAVEDDFGDYDPDTKPYHNQLLNSLGILLRTALNNLVSITKSAIAFYDGAGNAASNIVARFGSDGAQVGTTDESHLTLDYHSLRLVDRSGDTYFWVSDLRDASGTATVQEVFTGASSDGSGLLSLALEISSVVLVTVDEVEVGSEDYTWWNDLANYAYYLQFDTPPASGAEITVVYETESDDAKAYTFGTRRANDRLGAYSSSEGYENVASGFAAHVEGQANYARGAQAHAEGMYCNAKGGDAHAEGCNTRASGFAAHAEGTDSRAGGSQSHAQNRGTTAVSEDQTAMGRYNIPDSSGKYAIIVGNGTGENDRSDAYTLDWDGNPTYYGDLVTIETQNASGTNHGLSIVDQSGNGRNMLFGIGSGRTNRGIYDDKLGQWLMYANDSDVYFDGKILKGLAAKDSVSITVTSVSGTAKNTSAINTSYGYTIPISTPSGYTPIGIRSIAFSGTGNNNLVLRRPDIASSSSVTVAVRNVSTTDVAANAVSCTVEVYCIKTSAS